MGCANRHALSRRRDGADAAAAALSPLALSLRAAGLLGLPLILAPALTQAQADPPSAPAAAPAQLERVEVIGVSPLPGQGIDRNLLPYSTQVLKRDSIDAAQAVNSVDLLKRRVPGVQANDVQGSPFQTDLTYRGYRASGLLGAGQGLSVYLDGVRVNEPFGDVVNFDMIPEFAVSSISLVPGANPAFGLNSLGGALSYQTYDGRTAPGLRGEVSGGSFGRKTASFSYGASSDTGWHQYIAATVFDENGWRDESDGKIGQVLGKIGHDDGTTSWSTSLLLGSSKLVGNGLVPAYSIEDGELTEDLYFYNREAVYTYPDETKNKLAQLSVNFRHEIDANSSLSALVYIRKSDRDTTNGDTAEEPPAAPGDPNAAFNTTKTEQTSYGTASSYSRVSGPHQWQVGASLDHSKVTFKQYEQPGFFNSSRGVVPGDEPREISADVDGDSTTFGVYATDTWQIAPRTHLTGTVRYNRAKVSNQLSTRDDTTGVFEAKPDESFTYNSVNPAIGVAHRLEAGPTLFGNIARNTRVPTVIELGCADPNEPCRLPAGLQSDPYLDQVKSTTGEIGMRWPITRDVNFNVAAFRTDNDDDILFNSTSVNGQLGYFDNFPKTRNQGVDMELSARLGTVDLSAAFSYLKATYEANGVLRQGERNVTVTPGTQIAGLPRQTLKLAGDWRVAEGITIGADMQAFSDSVVAGNEDGLLEDGDPDGKRLKIPGYAIFNLRASWRPSPGWELYASVNNVFDRRYENYGALAETEFTPEGSGPVPERDALFVAPGTPRATFVGLRYRF
jgi:outer membrane receptor protein involved in Fe transport